MSAQASRRRCLLGRGRAFDASVLEFSSSINALEAGFLKRLCKLRIHNWEWRPLWTALLRVSPLWTLQRASIRTDRVNGRLQTFEHPGCSHELARKPSLLSRTQRNRHKPGYRRRARGTSGAYAHASLAMDTFLELRGLAPADCRCVGAGLCLGPTVTRPLRKSTAAEGHCNGEAI